VRCPDDGVAGRIVWASGNSVKITWDDGEQVTWRRDALAGRSIEILDADAASEKDLQLEALVAASASEQTTPTELPEAESPQTATTHE
jgi:hypothetical protein